MPLGKDVSVVVREFFTGLDVADGLDPDAIVFHDRIAIRVAGVIDESCFVAIHRGVDDDVVVDREEIGYVLFDVDFGIALVSFFRRDASRGVFD